MSNNRTFAEELARQTEQAQCNEQKKKRDAELEAERWANGTSKCGTELVEKTIQEILEKTTSAASKGAHEIVLRLEPVFATYKKSFWSGGESLLTPIWGIKLVNKLGELGLSTTLTHYKISICYTHSFQYCDGCGEMGNVPHLIISW